MNAKKVLITDPIHPKAVERLENEGLQVTELSEEDRPNLKNIVSTYDAIICRTSTIIDKNLLESATNLKCIALASTGYDRIDIEEASSRGIHVMGLPSFNSDIDPEKDGNFVSTAEHAVMLILATLGDFYNAYDSMKEKRWEKKYLVGNELAHKTVGILGLGRIGGLVASRLAPFNVRIVAHDKFVDKARAKKYGVKLLELSEFCKQCDIITIHIPKKEDTIGMLGKKEFDLMKDGVFIINTARAAIMDEQTLIESLKRGKVKRVALDVFHDEPDGLNWDLITMDNVIATPHIGGSTHEAWRRISISTADNVISCLNGKPINVINK